MLRFRTRTKKVTGGGGGGTPASGMLVGMNVGGVNVYSNNLPLADMLSYMSLFRVYDGATESIWQNQNQGQISGATGTQTFYATVANGDIIKSNTTFKVKNPGGNQIGFGTNVGVGATPSVQAFTTSTAFDLPWVAGQSLVMHIKGNSTGQINVLMAGHETSYAAGDYTNIDFVNFHAALGTRVLRFMDFTNTNANIDTDWTDRTLPNKIGHQGPGQPAVPWEIVAQVCNRLGCDGWINVPVRATTAYVTSLMALLQSLLNPGRVIYVEYGNELWNTAAGFKMSTSWAEVLTYTKFTLSVSGSTFTKTAHGYAENRRMRTFAGRQARGLGYDEEATGVGGVWWLGARGIENYVHVLTANTFELWDGPNGTGNRVGTPVGVTEVIAVDMSEAGKSVDLNGNYATKSISNWSIADAALTSARVKAVVGALAASASVATARLANTTLAARANHLAPAPYHDGYRWYAQQDRTSGQFLPRFWSSHGGTYYASSYAAGSTPTLAQRKAGTGTGFVGRSVVTTNSSNARTGVTVTITNASPAVVTWDTTAPPADTAVQFTTTGALPTGLTPATTYYVKSPSGNTFQLAASAGGAAINTSSAGSGVHTATAFYGSTLYVPGAALTGFVNTTSYDHWFDYVDPDGFTWTVKKTVAASATPLTTDFDDTYANQQLRDIWDMDSGDVSSGVFDQIQAHKDAIAACSNTAITIFNYEGGSHQDSAGPSAFQTWMEGYRESATYGGTLKHYYNGMAAKGNAGHCHYMDVSSNDANPTPWRIANTYLDTLDERFKAIASFAGAVPVRTLVDSATLSGTNFAAAPTYPAVVKTFADATWTYSLVPRETGSGKESGNYSITGNVLSIISGTGINFASPSTQEVWIFATDGYTDAYFKVTFTTGSAWYEATAKQAWAAADDGTPAQLNPVIGAAMSLTGTAATVVSDGWDLAGVAQYSGGHGNGTTPYTDSPLFLFAGRVDNNTGGFKGVVTFGSSPYVQWLTQGASGLYLDTTAFGTVSVAFDNTLKVRWIWFDNANLKYYYGENQTVTNVGGTAYTSQGAATFSDYVAIGPSPSPECVISATELVAASSLAAALAIVQKVQTKLGI